VHCIQTHAHTDICNKAEEKEEIVIVIKYPKSGQYCFSYYENEKYAYREKRKPELGCNNDCKRHNESTQERSLVRWW
jgi:hypothetical protein